MVNKSQQEMRNMIRRGLSYDMLQKNVGSIGSGTYFIPRSGSHYDTKHLKSEMLFKRADSAPKPS